MSIGKKIAHRAEAVKGSAMKTVGRLTGNRRLRARAAVTRPRARLAVVIGDRYRGQSIWTDYGAELARRACEAASPAT